jgi:uncharacterized protein (TIGR03435 family)
MTQMSLATFITALSAASALGQNLERQPTFDAATVRRAPPLTAVPARIGPRGGPNTSDPTTYICEYCTLSMLISYAYNLKNYELSAPDWTRSEMYMLNAKVPDGASVQQFRLMIQALLAGRFGLSTHRESRGTPGYELVVAKNGPKFGETDANRNARAETRSAGAPGVATRELDEDGYPNVPPFPGGSSMRIANGRARIRADGEVIERLARNLSGYLKRPVDDATGLKGRYYFVLSWSTELEGVGRYSAPPSADNAPPAPTAINSSGPTLFDALQSQLGLKLEPKKTPVEVLVIDHLEKVPTEN